MCLSPCSAARLFSILRATSFSSCVGAAPGRLATMVMLGTSRSGKFCTFIDWNENSPASVSMTNSIAAGIGFLMDQAETFMTGPSLDDFDQIGFVQEARALHRHGLVGLESGEHLHALADPPPGRHLALTRLVLRVDHEHEGGAVAHHDGLRGHGDLKAGTFA